VSDGVQAFAHSVTLSRPGIGPPVFYAVDAGRVLVASRLAPLLARLSGRPRWCKPRLASILATAAPDDPSTTPYEGVFRLPTHHSIHVWPDGRRQLTELVTPIEPLTGIEPAEAVREFKSRFLGVVKKHLEGRARVGVIVGGGVDSSAVLGAAIAVTRGASAAEVDAIGLDFAGPGDDRPYLRDLSEALGIVPIRVKPGAGGEHVRHLMTVDAAPLPWPNVGCEAALLSEARARGAEIALTGVGGDEYLDGDPYGLADRAVAGDWSGAVRDAARLRVYWREPGIGQAWEFVFRPLLVRCVPWSVRRWRRRRSRAGVAWAGPELRAYLDRASNVRPEAIEPSPSARYRRFVTLSPLREIVDMRAQMSMATGIDRVDPFLDDELLRFAFSLPPSMLMHGGRTRALVRMAMEGLVPDRVRWRVDKAWFEPAIAECIGAAGGFASFDDLARMDRLQDLGLVDAAAFGRAFRALADAPEDWADGWLEVWPALAVESFLSRNSVA
jgi:asparagine synthase (glutamine-hydrolysing)